MGGDSEGESDADDEELAALLGEDVEEEDADELAALLAEDGEEEDAEEGEEEAEAVLANAEAAQEAELDAELEAELAKEGGAEAEAEVAKELNAELEAEGNDAADDASDDDDDDDDDDEEAGDDDNEEAEIGEAAASTGASGSKEAAPNKKAKVDPGAGKEEATAGKAEDGAADEQDAAAMDVDEAGPEGEAPKRRGKPKDPRAPRKPLNPFQQFSAEARPRLAEEQPALKGDMLGMTKALYSLWGDHPADKKGEMQVIYDKEKVRYDALMVEYRKTAHFKAFQLRLNEWRDEKEMKKLAKKHKLAQPKKPSFGFQAFAAVGREKLKKDCPGMSMSETGKKLSEMWAELASSERQRYNKESADAREKWEKEMLVYRRSDAYRANVDEVADVEIKQGLRRLKAEYEHLIPKKPSNASQVYCVEVGLKASFVQVAAKFKALPAEEQQRYQEAAEKLRSKFGEDMTAFLASKDGVQYTRKMAMVKQKALVRAARRKFLVDAPKRPLAALGLFVERKKKELENSDDGSLFGAKLTAHIGKLWASLTEADRKPFEEEAARLLQDFHAATKKFQEGDTYQELKAAEARAAEAAEKARGRGKAKGKGKGKAKAKAKAKAKPKASSLVARPGSMPEKPPDAYRLWCRQKQAQGESATRALYAGLGEDEKKRLDAEVAKLHAKYTQDLAAFLKSKDGKAYTRKLESVGRKQKLDRAKAQLREAAPPKPPGAFKLFATAQKGSGGGRPAILWSKLSQDERKHWEGEQEKKLAEWEKAMQEFRKSSDYKKFERVAKAKAKSGGRSKAPAMEGAPKKPPNAFLFFMKEQKGSIASLEASRKKWAELGAEGQKKYVDQAMAAAVAHKEEVKVWLKTSAGKKHVQAQTRQQKKKTEQKAKDKYLKAPDAPEPPEKPKNAKMLFLEERRKQLLKDEPQLPPRDMAKRLLQEWESLSADAKKVWDGKERSLKDVYEFELEEYKNSEAYKRFAKATEARGSGKGSGRGRGGRSGNKKRKKGKLGDLSFDESDEMGSASDSDDLDISD